MILGCDVSHWGGRINFDVMKRQGIEYVIFKATQSSWFVDRIFSEQYEDAKQLIRGAYHYLDWNSDADRQAAHFCKRIEGRKLDFPPIVDFEERTNVPVQKVAYSELWTFCEIVKQKTGRIPIIYTSPSYWKEFGSKDKVWRDFPLWIANYYVERPNIPKPWTDYVLWQYTAKGDGIKYGCQGKEIDLNWFNGTVEELRAFCGLEQPTLPTRDEALDSLLREHGKNWK